MLVDMQIINIYRLGEDDASKGSDHKNSMRHGCNWHTKRHENLFVTDRKCSWYDTDAKVDSLHATCGVDGRSVGSDDSIQARKTQSDPLLGNAASVAEEEEEEEEEAEEELEELEEPE